MRSQYSTILASIAAVVQGGPWGIDLSLSTLQSLEPAASDVEFGYQPGMFFDNSCYNSVAIDISGYVNPGLGHNSACPNDGCREESQLLDNNVYSRMRCNNDICAILYAYYFLKDQTVCGSWGVGHQHEWENIVVFMRQSTGEILLVAPSAHHGYHGTTRTPMLSEGHPLVAYHQDGGLTHKMRMAHPEDWQRDNGFGFGPFHVGALVGWDHWPSLELRDRFLEAFDGGISAKLDDERFGEALEKAAKGWITEFDPWVDEYDESTALEGGEWTYEYEGEDGLEGEEWKDEYYEGEVNLKGQE